MKIKILLILFIVMMAPFASQAIIAPHDMSNGYRCTVCHNSHATLGTTGFNNICMTCHNSSHPKGYKSPFSQVDAANPYKSILNGYTGVVDPSKIYQTSHNWTGSDINPAAGALAPIRPVMNATATIKGALLCVRCHAVHGSRSSTTNSAPFLRDLNDKDQMCNDCHRTRNKDSHTFGTHPVNVNYTSLAKSKPEKFFPTPINANPDNTSSTMKLGTDGIVRCTTCHAVHYADSRSSTTDGAAAYNQLSTSRGYLLRTDARGKTAESINICTNCHASKGNHDGKKQNIQCNDCHSGHVEYDPYAVAGTDEADPNIYVVRRFMIISTAAGRETKQRTFYRYTGADPNLPKAKEYWLPGAVPGVCQACHNDTNNFKLEHYEDKVNYDKASGIDSRHKICANCHKHDKTGFGCGGCHGTPPTKNSAGTGGYARYSTIVYPLDESKTPHSTHADGQLYVFACSQCHKGNNHNTGNFQQVFIDHAGNVAEELGADPTYDVGERSCSTTYCHSNGRGSGYDKVFWQDKKDTIVKGLDRCQTCHGDNKNIDTDANVLSGAHERHAATFMANYNCQNCHALTLTATFNNNTGLIYPSTKHVDGTKNVKYGFTNNTTLNAMASVSYDAELKTCGTVYCHSNGASIFAKATPKWDDPTTGKCGTCHGVYGPVDANTIGMIETGIHFAHLSSTYGPKLRKYDPANACSRCHTSYNNNELTHVDGYKTANQTAGSDCYKCHGGTQQGPLPALGENNLTCTKCHPIWSGYSAARIGTVLAPKQVNYSTSGHGKRAAPYNKMVCTECHDRSSTHISKPPLLGDNKRLIAVNYSAARRGGTNAVCGTCHWAGQSAENKVRFTHVTSIGDAKSGSPSMACSRCHNVHGTSNFGMINNSIVFHPNSSAYPIVYQSPYSSVGLLKVTKNGPYNFIDPGPPFRGVCQVCHTRTMHFQRGRNESSDSPSKGLNINPNTGGSLVSHISMNQSTNCLSCHQHTPPPTSPGTYAFYPFGKCDACHGYPPVPKSHNIVQNNYSSGMFEDYTGGGGAHIVAGHVPPSANPSQSWDLCNSCHRESDHLSVPLYEQVKVTINDNFRFSQNQTIQTKYTSNRLGGALHKTGTCSNVSCHFQKTPAWGNPKMP